MINIHEVKNLLNDEKADNIICCKLELIPGNIAKFITQISNNKNNYGYIIIGVSKDSNTYNVNGISSSIKFDGIMQSAIKQLSFKPIIEYDKCNLDGKGIFIIRVNRNVTSSDNSSDIHMKNKKDDIFMALVNDLFSACMKLQRNFHYKNASEDERNDYIRDMLETKGYCVKDQTRQGTSNSGKASGEVDILIHEHGIPIAIVEALNLGSLNVTYLDNHIDKIYKYDTLGHPFNFVISYVKVKDFSTFMDNYCKHIKCHVYPYELIEIDENLDEDYNKFSEIRIIITKHNRDSRLTLLCHICVKIPE